MRRQGMKKRYSGVFGKTMIGLGFVFTMFFVSGCSDSDLEQENKQLKSNLIKTKSYNASLEANFEKATKDNRDLKKVLDELRENNKGLNVSLAKSELEFSKKHKMKLEAERKKLDIEKEAFKQKQIIIEEKAYENANNTVFNRYIVVFVGFLILFTLVFIFWFFNNKKNKQIIRDKEEEIEKTIVEKEESEKELKEKEERVHILENKINDLERMQKVGSKNQVVSKIEEYKAGIDRKLNSLRGDDNGN